MTITTTHLRPTTATSGHYHSSLPRLEHRSQQNRQRRRRRKEGKSGTPPLVLAAIGRTSNLVAENPPPCKQTTDLEVRSKRFENVLTDEALMGAKEAEVRPLAPP